ncbi:MAG TPA: NAD(P)/FAD-dependent oxidoreductase, partial [Myxococcota bacterium]|nr:NAD(P)/FAD-dependent oxidoreductase [Myxococcota bacterium]
AHYVAGGCATMFSRRGPGGRYHFDVGLHYVGDCGPEGAIPRILGELGLSLDDEPLDADGFDTLIFPDFRFQVPANRELFRERLVALFPKEKKGIDRYMRLLDEVEHLTRPGVGRGWRFLMDAALHGRMAGSNKESTVGAFLDTCTKDMRLRAVLTAQWGDYGVAPGRASLMLHAGLVNHYLKGAYYPRGGGQIIADRVAETLEKAGGSIHLRHLVSQIVVENGRAVGLRYKGPHGEEKELRAKTVVSNADYKRTLLELLPKESLPGEGRAKAAAAEMAGAIFLTCLGIRGDLAQMGMRNANYWYFEGYDFDSPIATATAKDVRGAYITSASRKDPGSEGHAPAGHQTIEVMGFVPGEAAAWGASEEATLGLGYRNSERYLAQKKEVEAALISKAEVVFPGLTERIVFQESATPPTQNRYTRASGGTSYGLAATPQQFMEHRPGYRGP